MVYSQEFFIKQLKTKKSPHPAADSIMKAVHPRDPWCCTIYAVFNEIFEMCAFTQKHNPDAYLAKRSRLVKDLNENVQTRANAKLARAARACRSNFTYIYIYIYILIYIYIYTPPYEWYMMVVASPHGSRCLNSTA